MFYNEDSGLTESCDYNHETQEGPPKSTVWGILTSPVARTLHFHCWGGVDSLVGELRAYVPHGAAKKKKKERERKSKRHF